MRITILDDYHDTLRTLPCFQKLAGHTTYTRRGVIVSSSKHPGTHQNVLARSTVTAN